MTTTALLSFPFVRLVLFSLFFKLTRLFYYWLNCPVKKKTKTKGNLERQQGRWIERRKL
jgi:hypothetical protein